MATDETYSKKSLISALKEGELVDDIFVVKMKKGMASYAKGYSFDLLLSDSSGKSIEYKYWGSGNEEKVKSVYDSIKADSVVHVQGKIGSYNNKKQLTTNEPYIIEALKEGQYNPADFVKPARRNIDEMYAELMKYVDSVSDVELKNFLKNIFADKLLKEKFMKHPAAIENHHNWISGLAQHTLEVLKYCKTSWEMYPELSRDLLIAGALLHDIGKLDELEVTARIKGTVAGQLVGHLPMGLSFVSKKLDESKVDGITKTKLLHLIISHHGRLDYGSPKEPMIPEAFALFYADMLSAKMAETLEVIKNGREDTEDDFIYYGREKKNIYLR